MKRSFALVLLLLACGCSDSIPCGDGTVAENGECTATLSPSCGPGTRLENSVCVPDNGGGAVCGPGTHSENGTCVPDINLSGNAARLYDVNLTAPADIVGLANGPFHEAFLSGQDLLFVGAYLPTATHLRIYGGGGTLKDDGTYALDRGKSFDTDASISQGKMQTTPFTFQMLAFGATQPVVLEDTVISEGVLDAPDGVTLLESGKLSGVLTPENAMAVYIETANLNMFDLLNSISALPDVDHDGNGVKESWTMTITFSTVPVWLF